MNNIRFKQVIRALFPLVFVLTCSTIIHGAVYREYGLIEVFSSRTTLYTLLPRFFLLLPHVSKIRCETIQVAVCLSISMCIVIVFFNILGDSGLTINVILSMLYMCLGAYIEYNPSSEG